MITLKRSQKILADKAYQAYRVVSGRVLVFLQPYSTEGIQKQMFLREAERGDIIPSLNLTDKKNEMYFSLFLFAEEETELENTENTEEVKKAFYASVLDQMEEEQKAPEMELLMFYYQKRENSKGRVQNMHHREETSENHREVIIHSVFQKKRERRLSSVVRTGNSRYDAAAYLCSILRIPIASLRRIEKACKGNISLNDIARISDFVCREVTLENGWQKEIAEPMLCSSQSDDLCLCIPGYGKKLEILDPKTGRIHRAKAEDLRNLNNHAWVFHRPFQKEKVDITDVTRMAAGNFSVRDLLLLLLCMFLVTVTGIETANLSQMIYDVIIPQGDSGVLWGIGGVFFLLMLSGLCFSVSQNLIAWRIDSRVRYTLQAAVYERVFQLPESFFGRRNSAEQAYRIQLLTSSYMRIYNNAAQIILQSTFSLMYLWKMYHYSAKLSRIAVVFLMLNIIVTVAAGMRDRAVQREKSRATGKMRAFLYQALSGIETIRLFGAEDDVLNEQMKLTGNVVLSEKKAAENQKLSAMFRTLNNVLPVIVMYYIYAAGNTGISIGAFMGFIMMFLSFSSVMCMVASNGMEMTAMLPMMKDASELLSVQPESSAKGEIPNRMKGEIQLSHISFGYGNDRELILKDFSLHISPGEYVAVVGETGSGKTTLLRLLLGFERPQTGKIYYDGISLERFSMPELRRQIGVVLQDGCLFSGSIAKNIRITNPQAGMEEVRQAAADAGILELIDRLPMGMDTFVSEGGRTFSGGEKQRILIARALLGNPKILFLDEATSSLDNRAQEEVCKNLEKYHATRLVIAHRLSTIEHCDRILVLDKGQIVESGTFEELMEKQGKFFELAKNQML